jgi:gamma-glutamylcyclotransferase (GGCT)/AIG2-like uncharacterized protein YtfP
MDQPHTEPTELLFSYGTLQIEPVQMATFGRMLEGTEDHLVGYELEWLEIADPSVIEASGKSCHPIIVFTGRETDLVCGTALRISRNEILQADTYEVADYRREYVTLASGRGAWVYVDARAEGPKWRGRAEQVPCSEEKS